MACSRPNPMMDRSPATSSTLRMPCASKILAPIWAATMKPMKKYRMNSLACRTFCSSASSPYTLTKYMTGMNAMEAANVARADSENRALRNTPMVMMGRVVRLSWIPNARNRMTLQRRPPMMRTSVHPTVPPCCRGMISDALANATSTAPGQSMEASPAARPVLPSAGVSAHIRDTAAMARGRLMKNTARQEKVMR